MDVDEALSRLGRFGRSKWQMLTYSLVCTSVTMSGCWHMMVIVFSGGIPDHHCNIPEGNNRTDLLPRSVIKGREQYSQCKEYANRSHGNETESCTHGMYYYPEYDETIVTEWDLVCDNNYLMELSQSFFAAGVMLGALVLPALADRIGRRPVHVGCQWLMVILGLATAGAGLTGIVMACELFPATERTYAGTALELFWATSWMLLAGICYLITHWRYLTLTVTLIPVSTNLLILWFLPESIPWLAANGREDEADVIIRRAAKADGIHFDEGPILSRPDQAETPAKSRTGDAADLDETLPLASHPEGQNHKVGNNMTSKNDTKHKIRSMFASILPRRKTHRNDADELSYSCLDIARHRRLLLNCFIMCSLWAASGIIYFGLSLSTSELAGDKYLNFFFSGAVEAPAYLSTVYLLQRFGRRLPLFGFHCVAGIVLFASVFIPEKTAGGTDLTAVIITLSMVGKFAMTAAFGTVCLYAPEIYPTNLRNLGFGISSAVGRLASTIAPFSALVGRKYTWLPSIVYTVVALTTGLMALMLPETVNRPLPDTIEEIENWSKPYASQIGNNVGNATADSQEGGIAGKNNLTESPL